MASRNRTTGRTATHEAGSAGEFFVPYKNGSALTAYYLGIFSCIPVIGIFMGVPAVILGIRGIGLAIDHPEIRGKIHALVGILAGSLFTVIQLIVLGIVIAKALGSSGTH
jgi:hypothetical protein